MYRCHIHFYLTGYPSKAFEIIKESAPCENFTHEFSQSREPDAALAAKADVIFVDLQEMDAQETLRALLSHKKKEADMILLADKEQILLLSDDLSEVKDIWTSPMSEEEIRFRFLRWQQTCKMSKDFWQTNHFWQAAIDSTPNLIWYKDKNGIHEIVNNSFCRAVNKTKQQVEGRGHAYIWDVEQDDPACIESELEVMTKKETCITEETIQTGDGTRLLTTYKSPLYDLDGNVMGTVGVAIDVTQERAYKQELIKNSHTLETLFSTMDCGVIYHTLDGTDVISINRAALEILGYESLEELLADGFDTVPASVVEQDKEKLRDSIRMLEREGDSVSREYRVQHKNGEIRYLIGNIKLLKENGQLLCQQSLLDCTIQKLEEERERVENERQQTELIRALSIDYNLVFHFNLDTGMGTVLRIDEEDVPILGSAFADTISLKESMELYIEKFVYEDDREMMRQITSLDRLEKDLTEKKLYYVNYRAFINDEIKYFQMKVVRTGEWERVHAAIVGFCSVDEETREEMEQKSLLQDALLQANRASKAKSTFLSNMSHDIRTPMNAIVGFTALAMTHINRKEQVAEYLTKIMTSGNHLLSLINDILDMSRIESGKMHLDIQPCSLPDILHGLRNIVQADVHAKQLDLYIDAVDVLDEQVYCDSLRLNQVLLNLLSNAIKYTPTGGTVSMRIIEKAAASAEYANFEFHIKDNGIGMSEEFVTHIFEPFERERNSTISGIQGTGLGMAITKNIVDLMNGTIEVKSEQGAGTEFLVSFTFRLCAEEKKPLDIPKLRDLRALVVDDDFNTCDTVSYMLQQIGMRAEWTLSGKEAILHTRQAIMRGDRYCVYIIDWLMPDMNGIEVARRIRKETGEDVPIIVLTAYDWSDIEEEAKEAGISAFCSKPIFLSELRNCLNSIVNSDGAQDISCIREVEKLRDGRILLAEDNELNQEIATAILEEAGFSVEIAGNGEIAIEMLERSEPGYYQLILMDVQMPVMNGYDAAKAIRRLENEELSSIPILAMTANAFEEDKQEAIRCGMNGHVAKPIDIDKLFEALDNVLSM